MHYRIKNNIMDFQEKQLINKDDIEVVLYHGHCSDGFGSAFIVYHYFKKRYGSTRADQIKYRPCIYSREPTLPDTFLEKLTGKNILMCDFSYKYDQLCQIISKAKTFMILDHHKTAQADLQMIPDVLKIFDMNRSGAGITWDFFFPNEPIPRFLAHIQDRDLWTNKIPQTTEFVTYFYNIDFKFDLWEPYLADSKVDEAIAIGKTWLDYQKIIIDRIVHKTSYVIQEINKQSMVVLYVNSSEFKSDIGNYLFKKFPIGDFSVVWDYDLYRNQTNFSLRSLDDRADVSAIAKQLGGGGHRNASGVGLNGLTGQLPFPIIDDHGTLNALIHGTRGTIAISNHNYDQIINQFTDQQKKSQCKQHLDDNITYSYILLKVDTIKSEWLDLIKNKTKDATLIVFELVNDRVGYNKETSEIIKLKEYTMYYNEKAIKQPEKHLQLLVGMDVTHGISFVSEKEFSDIFNVPTSSVNEEVLDDIITEWQRNTIKNNIPQKYVNP